MATHKDIKFIVFAHNNPSNTRLSDIVDKKFIVDTRLSDNSVQGLGKMLSIAEKEDHLIGHL